MLIQDLIDARVYYQMMSVEKKIRKLIEEAKLFLEKAREEYVKARQAGDVLAIRDAAEKAWNAIVQATNALVLHYTGKLPTSHFERRKLLRELEKRVPEVEQLGLLDRYMARYRVLHGETFYEGIIDFEQLDVEFEKVRKYIQDIEKMLEKEMG